MQQKENKQNKTSTINVYNKKKEKKEKEIRGDNRKHDKNTTKMTGEKNGTKIKQSNDKVHTMMMVIERRASRQMLACGERINKCMIAFPYHTHTHTKVKLTVVTSKLPSVQVGKMKG